MFRNYRAVAGDYPAAARRTFPGVAGLATVLCLSIFVTMRYGHGFDRGHHGSRIYRVNSYEQFLKQEPGRMLEVLGTLA